jgi:hypothetical protein
MEKMVRRKENNDVNRGKWASWSKQDTRATTTTTITYHEAPNYSMPSSSMHGHSSALSMNPTMMKSQEQSFLNTLNNYVRFPSTSVARSLQQSIQMSSLRHWLWFRLTLKTFYNKHLATFWLKIDKNSLKYMY